jgi:FAD/FMN-containing dehydrogenase
MDATVIQQIKAGVSAPNLLTFHEERRTYADDATDRAHLPNLVVFPGAAAEIAQIVTRRIMPQANLTPNPRFPQG